MTVRSLTKQPNREKPLTETDLLGQIEHLLREGRHSAAKELVARAHEFYPKSRRLDKLVRVLSAPRVVDVKVKPKPELALSTAWVSKNAGQYRGKWVVVLDGKLIESAGKLSDLQSVMERLKGQPGLLVTKIV